MSLHIRVLSRDFADTIQFPGVDLAVERYSHDARGGPRRCVISAAGHFLDLWDMMAHLRAPVEIYDHLGETVWWGYIHKVNIQTELTELSVDLDRMANSIAVGYSTRGSGQGASGSSGTTSYAENADSIATFGKKQKLLGGRDMTGTEANQFRDAALERLKNPVPSVSIRESNEVRGEIEARGWWSTLEWIYYTVPATNEVGPRTYTAGQPFGDGATVKASQTFTVSSTEDALPFEVDCWLKKIGSPTGNVTLSIYTDGGGSPGILIISNSIAVGDISVDFLPETFDMSAATTDLTSGTTYWIVVEPTGGSTNASNHFEVGVNEDAEYAGGQFYTYDGATWTADATKDMAFVVAGTRDTDTQISNILSDSDVGQFFTAVEVTATSIEAPAKNQNGDMTALEIIEELLDTGTTNDRRLVAKVTKERRVVVEEEAGAGSDNYFLLAGPEFETNLGIAIPKSHIHKVVRRWVTPRDLASILANTVVFADAANIFVESIEYDARRDEIRPRSREGRDIFDLVRLAP